MTGVSDHFVSEALYLRDPDGHGIEIYADRPREVWEGQVATDDHRAARPREPPRRARRSRAGALRRPAPRNGHGPRPSPGRRHPGDAAVLSRRHGVRRDGDARLAGDVPLRRRLPPPRRRQHLGERGSPAAARGTRRRYGSRRRPAGLGQPRRGRRPGGRRPARIPRRPPKGRSSGTRPETACCWHSVTSRPCRGLARGPIERRQREGTSSRMRVVLARPSGFRRPSTSGLATDAPTGVTRCSQSEERNGVRTGTSMIIRRLPRSRATRSIISR